MYTITFRIYCFWNVNKLQKQLSKQGHCSKEQTEKRSYKNYNQTQNIRDIYSKYIWLYSSFPGSHESLARSIGSDESGSKITTAMDRKQDGKQSKKFVFTEENISNVERSPRHLHVINHVMLFLSRARQVLAPCSRLTTPGKLS